MKSWRTRLAPALLCGLFTLFASATPSERHPSASGKPERYRLYTKPDPSSTGGITGTIDQPRTAITQILAIPPDEPRLVYKGTVQGPDRRGFSFEGLPMRKYDLVVIYDDRFYEGLTLHRGESTLTEEDHRKINETVQKAEPYFTRHFVHRVAGETGRGNLCRAVCTYLRDKASTNGPDYRRSFRLLMMKDVGPGWQIVRSRDLYPTWTKPQYATPTHHYDPQLAGVRVTNRVKDLGSVRLAP